LQSPETAEHLCGKCEAYAVNWQGTADELWAEHPHVIKGYVNYRDRDKNRK
jgi:hypothetical protein